MGTYHKTKDKDRNKHKTYYYFGSFIHPQSSCLDNTTILLNFQRELKNNKLNKLGWIWVTIQRSWILRYMFKELQAFLKKHQNISIICFLTINKLH